MSVKAMTWVFEHSPYTLGARLIHLAIADWANDDHGGLLWAHQGKLAEKAKVSRSTVNAALQRMVAEGFLEEVSAEDAALVRGKRDPRAKVYRFLMCQISDTSRGGRSVDLEGPNCQVDDAGSVKLTESHYLLTQEELKVEHNAEIAKARRDPLYGFDRFWKRYPRRNGVRDAKQPAQAEWRKLSYEEKAAAYHHLLNYVDACERGLRTVANASTWLHQRRWEEWDKRATDDPVSTKPNALDVVKAAYRQHKEAE